MSIKSYIYLDDNKMFSLSSQLFEGITQYILNENTDAIGENHEQKGQLLSGRFMADMMFQKNTKAEMRYLHDFAFNLFEAELVSRDLLYEVKAETVMSDLIDKSFVKVKGKIVFEDYARILYTLEHFNEIGTAIGELTLRDELEQAEAVLDAAGKTSDREKKNKVKQAGKQIKKEFERALLEQGLVLDESTRGNILKVLDFGYHDNYEIRFLVVGSDTLFTTIINQENLKEPGQALISKYSRLSEKEFTVIGLVTQCGEEKAKIPDLEGNDMKKATIVLTEKIDALEEQFNGRFDNECIIDPIAIYTEV